MQPGSCGILAIQTRPCKRSHEALTLAQELSHPFSLAFALVLCCLAPSVPPGGAGSPRAGRGSDNTLDRAGVSVLVGGRDYPAGLGAGRAGTGRRRDCQIRQGLAACQATGAELARPYYLALLAEAYGKVGQAEEGLTVLAEALAVVDKTGERFYEAELYRLKGRADAAVKQVSRQVQTSLEVANPQPLTPNPQAEAEAEACFHKAIEIARRQQAKSLELRAVMSLSRLWQQQGKKEEARQMLAEIYGWFTEGFDTKDLQEAKALLEELEGQGIRTPSENRKSAGRRVARPKKR